MYNTTYTSYDKDCLTLSVTIILAVFIVVTILGNGLVCLALYRQPHIRKVTYYPILSLAFADLLCGAIAMPAYIAKKHVVGGWKEGVVCDIFRFSYFFTEYASVVSLTAISLERFISVKMPVKHRMWLTKRKMTAALVVSWFDAAIVSVLPFFWQKKDEKEPCRYNPTKEWSMMVILVNVFFPFLIMLCCHVFTVSYALRVSRRARKPKAVDEAMETVLGASRHTSLERKDAIAAKRERDVTCTLGMVVGAFVICWGPSSFYYFIGMVCPQCFGPSFKQVKQIFNAVVKLLTFANSCLNPLIYCWLNQSLRSAFYHSLLGKKERRRRMILSSQGYSVNSTKPQKNSEEKKRKLLLLCHGESSEYTERITTV